MERDPNSYSSTLWDDINQHCESLLGTIPGVVYSLDEKGEFTYLSDNVESTLGFTQCDLVGHHFSAIVHPSDICSVSREYILPRFVGIPTGNERAPKLFDERRSWRRKTANLQMRLCPKKGFAETDIQSFNCKVNASGHYNSQNQFCGTIGIMYDIIEDYEKIISSPRNQKYNAFELLTQALSHVFSNVFTGIYGNLQLIEMQLDRPRNITDNIAAIKHSVENAVTLVKRLANMLSTNGWRDDYSLKNLLIDTADEHFSTRGVTYQCGISPNVWDVASDLDTIRHIMRAVYFHIARMVTEDAVVSIKATNVHEAPVKLPRIDCAYIMIDIRFGALLTLKEGTTIDEFTSLERIASMALSYELLKKIGGILTVDSIDQDNTIQLYLPAIRS